METSTTTEQNPLLAQRHLSFMHMRSAQDHFKEAITCMLRGLDGDADAAGEIAIARAHLMKAQLALTPRSIAL